MSPLHPDMELHHVENSAMDRNPGNNTSRKPSGEEWSLMNLYRETPKGGELTEPVGGDLTENDRLHISIPFFLILTIITCGLFNIYWNYRQMEGCNEMLGRAEFNFWLWIFLSIITCGIYHIFYQHKMAKAILEIQQIRDVPLFDSLPMISVLISIFASPVIVDCLHQSEINKLVR